MLNDRAYVFASSFLRAADGRGTPAERLARFGEAQSKEALRTDVAETYKITGSLSEVYEGVISDAVEKMRGSLPDIKVIYPLLYKYDCTNIKTAVKCAAKGISAYDMMFGCGTVAGEKVAECAKKSDFSALPDHMSAMRHAADEALSRYRKTGEVRAIDLMLDAACFEDMRRSADEGAVELIKNIVTLRADAVNVMTCMRIGSQKMMPAAAASLMQRAYVTGGDIPLSAFLPREGGCADAADAIKKAPAGSVSTIPAKCAADASDFADAEKIFDEAVLRMADKYRFKPFGAEIAVRFLLLREAEMTNCRIIEAAMNQNAAVRERMRKAYV